MLRAVLPPPFETGIIWSYSKFFRLPHFTHMPPSLRQTSLRTSDGRMTLAITKPGLNFENRIGSKRRQFK
jgi:hypothetical protein